MNMSAVMHFFLHSYLTCVCRQTQVCLNTGRSLESEWARPDTLATPLEPLHYPSPSDRSALSICTVAVITYYSVLKLWVATR